MPHSRSVSHFRFQSSSSLGVSAKSPSTAIARVAIVMQIVAANAHLFPAESAMATMAKPMSPATMGQVLTNTMQTTLMSSLAIGRSLTVQLRNQTNAPPIMPYCRSDLQQLALAERRGAPHERNGGAYDGCWLGAAAEMQKGFFSRSRRRAQERKISLN
jgi:hypothetical protein